jgi:hypothetical protein
MASPEHLTPKERNERFFTPLFHQGCMAAVVRQVGVGGAGMGGFKVNFVPAEPALDGRFIDLGVELEGQETFKGKRLHRAPLRAPDHRGGAGWQVELFPVPLVGSCPPGQGGPGQPFDRIIAALETVPRQTMDPGTEEGGHELAAKANPQLGQMEVQGMGHPVAFCRKPGVVDIVGTGRAPKENGGRNTVDRGQGVTKAVANPDDRKPCLTKQTGENAARRARLVKDHQDRLWGC